MNKKSLFIMGVAGFLSLFACSGNDKSGNVQSEGSLDISGEPDPLVISTVPATYAVTVTGNETGGVGVDFKEVTVVLTFLDGSHIVLGQEDLTETMFTWIASSPEEGGPVTDILEEFWHFEPNEEKITEILIKIGSDFNAPEGFEGLYLPVFYLQMTVALGKSGFKITMTYEAVDTNEKTITGTVSLRLEIVD